MPGEVSPRSILRGDHHGANLILQDGDRIWGVHSNIGRFEIPSTATVTVRPYNPSVPASGGVEVYADRVVVLGVLDATGAGYTGGGGGVGGSGAGSMDQWPNLEGKPGIPGEGRYPGFTGPAIGDGPFGGKEGWPPHYRGGEDGGFAAEAGNGDVTTDASIRLGSGGQGGMGYPSADIFYGMPAGGGGGSGGGSVLLCATSRLELRGSITTRGTVGQNGENGKAGEYWPNFDGSYSIYGGDGANGGSALPWEQGKGGHFATEPNGYAGSGGAGAGGGVLLACETTGGLVLQGSIDARGGRDQMSNGGTIKLFYRGNAPSTGAIQSPRIYLQDLDLLPPASGVNGLLFF